MVCWWGRGAPAGATAVRSSVFSSYSLPTRVFLVISDVTTACASRRRRSWGLSARVGWAWAGIRHALMRTGRILNEVISGLAPCSYTGSGRGETSRYMVPDIVACASKSVATAGGMLIRRQSDSTTQKHPQYDQKWPSRSVSDPIPKFLHRVDILSSGSYLSPPRNRKKPRPIKRRSIKKSVTSSSKSGSACCSTACSSIPTHTTAIYCLR